MATNGQGDDWNGFVNIRLETHHKTAIKALVANSDDADWVAFLLESVDDGYQISMAPDGANDAIICTMTGKGEDCVNRGFSMSQRHSDPLVALGALRFAHEEIGERGDWQKVQYDWRKTDW